MALNWVTVGFLCTGCFWFLVSSEKLWQKLEQEHSRLCPWECMIFVQMWPGSFCVSLTSKLDCILTKNAKNWTIHGLWPNDIKECCPYWQLFPSDLTNLVSELNSHWPTFTNLTSFQFWEKEWKKHGTCAGCMETLNSPNKFFGAALFLRTKYNIDGRTGSTFVGTNQSGWRLLGVNPALSCRFSRFSGRRLRTGGGGGGSHNARQIFQTAAPDWVLRLHTFTDILRPLLGPQYELQCVMDGQGRQILVQIKVSLFGNFSTGCFPGASVDISPYQPCKAQRRIFYVPPNLKNPRNPCP